MEENARGALQRALMVYCKRRPEMHIFAAHWDEKRGDVEAARTRYKFVLGELSPRLLSAITAAANFERRQVRGGMGLVEGGGVHAYVCVRACVVFLIMHQPQSA